MYHFGSKFWTMCLALYILPQAGYRVGLFLKVGLSNPLLYSQSLSATDTVMSVCFKIVHSIHLNTVEMRSSHYGVGFIAML